MEPDASSSTRHRPPDWFDTIVLFVLRLLLGILYLPFLIACAPVLIAVAAGRLLSLPFEWRERRQRLERWHRIRSTFFLWAAARDVAARTGGPAAGPQRIAEWTDGPLRVRVRLLPLESSRTCTILVSARGRSWVPMSLEWTPGRVELGRLRTAVEAPLSARGALVQGDYRTRACIAAWAGTDGSMADLETAVGRIDDLRVSASQALVRITLDLDRDLALDPAVDRSLQLIEALPAGVVPVRELG